MFRNLMKYKPLLHSVAIVLSAIVSGITALQLGGDPALGAAIGAGANGIASIASA